MTKTMTNKRPRISSHGRFRDTRGIVKSPIAGNDGYKSRQIQVNRLVCRAFHGPAHSPAHEVDTGSVPVVKRATVVQPRLRLPTTLRPYRCTVTCMMFF